MSEIELLFLSKDDVESLDLKFVRGYGCNRNWTRCTWSKEK